MRLINYFASSQEVPPSPVSPFHPCSWLEFSCMHKQPCRTLARPGVGSWPNQRVSNELVWFLSNQLPFFSFFFPFKAARQFDRVVGAGNNGSWWNHPGGRWGRKTHNVFRGTDYPGQDRRFQETGNTNIFGFIGSAEVKGWGEEAGENEIHKFSPWIMLCKYRWALPFLYQIAKMAIIKTSVDGACTIVRVRIHGERQIAAGDDEKENFTNPPLVRLRVVCTSQVEQSCLMRNACVRN